MVSTKCDPEVYFFCVYNFSSTSGSVVPDCYSDPNILQGLAHRKDRLRGVRIEVEV